MNEKNDQREIKIELTPEMASGKYANWLSSPTL